MNKNRKAKKKSFEKENELIKNKRNIKSKSNDRNKVDQRKQSKEKELNISFASYENNDYPKIENLPEFIFDFGGSIDAFQKNKNKEKKLSGPITRRMSRKMQKEQNIIKEKEIEIIKIEDNSSSEKEEKKENLKKKERRKGKNNNNYDPSTREWNNFTINIKQEKFNSEDENEDNKQIDDNNIINDKKNISVPRKRNNNKNRKIKEEENISCNEKVNNNRKKKNGKEKNCDNNNINSKNINKNNIKEKKVKSFEVDNNVVNIRLYGSDEENESVEKENGNQVEKRNNIKEEKIKDEKMEIIQNQNNKKENAKKHERKKKEINKKLFGIVTREESERKRVNNKQANKIKYNLRNNKIVDDKPVTLFSNNIFSEASLNNFTSKGLYDRLFNKDLLNKYTFSTNNINEKSHIVTLNIIPEGNNFSDKIEILIKKEKIDDEIDIEMLGHKRKRDIKKNKNKKEIKKENKGIGREPSIKKEKTEDKKGKGIRNEEKSVSQNFRCKNKDNKNIKIKKEKIKDQYDDTTDDEKKKSGNYRRKNNNKKGKKNKSMKKRKGRKKKENIIYNECDIRSIISIRSLSAGDKDKEDKKRKRRKRKSSNKNQKITNFFKKEFKEKEEDEQYKDISIENISSNSKMSTPSSKTNSNKTNNKSNNESNNKSNNESNNKSNNESNSKSNKSIKSKKSNNSYNNSNYNNSNYNNNSPFFAHSEKNSNKSNDSSLKKIPLISNLHLENSSFSYSNPMECDGKIQLKYDPSYFNKDSRYIKYHPIDRYLPPVPLKKRKSMKSRIGKTQKFIFTDKNKMNIDNDNDSSDEESYSNENEEDKFISFLTFPRAKPYRKEHAEMVKKKLIKEGINIQQTENEKMKKEEQSLYVGSFIIYDEKHNVKFYFPCYRDNTRMKEFIRNKNLEITEFQEDNDINTDEEQLELEVERNNEALLNFIKNIEKDKDYADKKLSRKRKK